MRKGRVEQPTTIPCPKKTENRMTAVQAIEWLNDFCSTEKYSMAFERLYKKYGYEYGFTDVLEEYTPEEIVRIMEENRESEGGKMDKSERDAAYRSFLSAYGDNAQIDMAVEEMSELIKALMKWKRADDVQDLQKVRREIIGELADVRIMVRQMEILFQCEGDVEKKIDFKTERQMIRLQARGGKTGK